MISDDHVTWSVLYIKLQEIFKLHVAENICPGFTSSLSKIIPLTFSTLMKVNVVRKQILLIF